MPATTNQQQTLTTVHGLLKKKLAAPPDPVKRPVLEEVAYALCREGAGPDDAEAAFERLKRSFYDWNEVRVSSVQEVSDALKPLPQSGQRAKRLIGLLQEIFEMTYSFTLDDLDKKGLKQAAKQLSRYKDVDDFVVAWVTQRALGGHAVPLDEPNLIVLQRLGVVDAEVEDVEAVRGGVEHVIPKAKAAEFTDLLSTLARDVCTPKVPHCPNCPLKAECPTGQEVLSAAKKAGAEAKPKPKSR